MNYLAQEMHKPDNNALWGDVPMWEKELAAQPGYVENYLKSAARGDDPKKVMSALGRVCKTYRKYPHLCLSNDAQVFLLRWGEQETDFAIKEEINAVLAVAHINGKRKGVKTRYAS